MPSKFVTIVGVATWPDEAPGDAHPEHPIYIPPPPNVPAHPIELPPLPPVDPGSGGIPTHPIFIPPGIWGGANEPLPTPPIAPGGPPPQVAHPIELPPSIWGPTDPRPSVPIYLPGPPPAQEPPRTEYTWAWSPYYSCWIILPPQDAPQPKKK